MELEPGDRRCRQPARRRDAYELRELVRDRVSLERPDDARRDDEDRRDCGERELEAGVEERIRVPAEEHGCADEQRLPPVALATREPGERAEGGGERSAHDGWMEPDRERIRRHRGQRRELGDVDSEAEKQDDCGSATTDRGDLQPVDGEAVVEARGPEVGEEALIHAGGPPEDDRLDHVAALAVQSPRGVAAQPAPDAIADAGHSPAPPHDPKRLGTQDRVDALPAEPRRLVEAVRRPRRSLQLAEQPEPRALRRRTSERELEKDRLVDAQRPPTKHERLHPLVEAPRPRRLLDLDHRPLRGVDPGREHAVVELSQAHAPPAPGGDNHSRSECRPPEARAARRRGR